MTEKIVNGDYEFDQYKMELKTVEHIQELLQTVVLHLTARRGAFYPNKNFGSLLRAVKLEQPKNEYALAYARQAVDLIDGVFIKSATVGNNEIIFNLTINDEERQVSIKLENNI